MNGCENRNGFLQTFLRKHREVSKGYLQGYSDFLSLLLSERGDGLPCSSPISNHLET